MAISKSMLPEFDYEMASTRKTLERIPDDKFDWKPHDKSMSMGGLATHLANLPTWATRTINKDSFDMAPQGGPPLRQPQASSRSEILDTFDKNVAEARAMGIKSIEFSSYPQLVFALRRAGLYVP